MELTMTEGQTKKLLKEVMLELIQERQDIFLDIMVEALEEAGLAAAIREGRVHEYVDEADIRAILNN